MRILYVVPYVPSLIRVRPYNLIRRLHARGHHVTVATLWTTEHERRELGDLAEHCSDIKAVPLPPWRSVARCAATLLTSEPLQTRYSWSPDLMAQINTARGRADVVHIEHLRGVQYGLDPGSRLDGVPVIWDSVDCISELFEQSVRNRRDRVGRWINQLELSRTRACEARAIARFDRVIVTSGTDKAAMRQLAGATPDTISVLPNGVDLDYFTPAQQERDPNTIVFSGKLSYHANEAAVRYLLTAVMPRVWTVRPHARLVLVGKDPSAKLRQLAAQWPANVMVTGTVPDVRPYLRRAAIAVAPLVYGVGCQNKVLEAMACGTPVVATPRAVGALTARPGHDVVVAEDEQRFAQAVSSLLQSPEQRHDLGRAGRAYVEAHHQWDLIAARLERLYQSVAAERGPRLERVAG